MSPNAAMAQYGNPLTENGFKPFGSFDLGDIDSVNLVNLELNLHIPLGPSYPQRGKIFPFAYHVAYTTNNLVVNHEQQYDCHAFSHDGDCIGTISVLTGNFTTGGLGILSENEFRAAGNSVLSSDGAVHEMANVPALGGNMTLDVSGFYETNPIGQPPNILKNGSGVSITYSATGGPDVYSDTNATPNTFTNGYNAISDTIGRPLPYLASLPTLSGLYPNGASSGGGWETTTDFADCAGQFPTVYAVTINFPSYQKGSSSYKLCYATFYVAAAYESINDFTYGGTIPYGGYVTPGQMIYPPVIQLQSIVLPNSKAYTFTYDGYPTSSQASQAKATGDLLKITLPAGGSISYGWADGIFPTGTGGPHDANQITRILTSRTVDANDGTGPHTWRYKLAAGPGDDQYFNGGPNDYPYLVIVTDPSGSDIVHTFTDVDMPDDSNTYYETATQFYQGSYTAASPSLLKAVATHYRYTSWQLHSDTLGDIGYPHAINIAPDTITTTYPDGSGLKRSLSYDSGYQIADADGRLTSVYAIVGNATSVTDVDLRTNSTISVTTNQYKTDQASKNAWLVHLLTNSKVVDGAGNTVSETQYGYDGAGNLQSTTKLVASSRTAPAVTYGVTYNGNGMPISMTDPMQNATTIHYNATGLFRDYIQKTTTNSLAHIHSYDYDTNTGKLNSQTDENSNQTKYFYNDPLVRLTQILYPPTTSGQGQVNLTYNDSALTVTSMTTASPDPTITTVQAFDGLGRVRQIMGANGATSETTYNGVGGVASVSSPHFTVSSPTDGVTTFAYDALGRKTLQTQQDSTTQQWLYNSDTVTFSDETGHSRVSVSDALGRLTDVYEDSTGSNMHTHYDYDTLNNLKEVTQSGASEAFPRIRRFNYDWLSRLQSATNPESGTISYSYVNGNGGLCAGDVTLPCSKTDARGITTSYVYDALNRLTQRSYSDGTATDCWSYDSAANGVGHLAQQWRQSSSCGASAGANALTSETITQYDEVGRVKQEKQCVLTICTNDGALTFEYDLAGSLTKYNVPTARDLMTVGVGYNAAGWANVFTSNVAGSQAPAANLLNISDFFPTGALSAGTAGTNLSVTKTYDSRQRSTGEVVHVK